MNTVILVIWAVTGSSMGTITFTSPQHCNVALEQVRTASKGVIDGVCVDATPDLLR